MVRLCKYRFVAGAKKGTTCDRVLRTDSDYCHLHKKQGAEVNDKYKEKLESIDKRQRNPTTRTMDDELLASFMNRGKKSDEEEDELDKSVESEEENIKTVKRVQKQKQKPKLVKEVIDISIMNEDELIDLLHKSVSEEEIDAKLVMRTMKKLKSIHAITDEQYNNLLEKYVL